jgi:membrane associated rhomboid family serine protease
MTEDITPIEEIVPVADDPFKKYLPVVTVIVCLVCVALFIGINLHSKADELENHRRWGAPPLLTMFSGDYWGLITSNFVHIAIWHIFFNLSWFWPFGKRIEFESNKLFYIFLILSSALVSSLSQLAFADDTGIGLSGIVYAFFGYLFVKSKTTPAYKDSLDKGTIKLFLIWLVVCIVLTQMNILNIGNAAHIGGLCWGALMGYASKLRKPLQWVAGLGFMAVLTVLIFYGPFSTCYLSYQAYKLHEGQKVEEAMVVYRKILSRDKDNEFAKQNLRQLKIHLLEEKALELHKKEQFSEARKVYNQILLLDKENAWALENLNRLPAE